MGLTSGSPEPELWREDTLEGLWKGLLPRARPWVSWQKDTGGDVCRVGLHSLPLFESSLLGVVLGLVLKGQLIFCEDRPLLLQLVGVTARGGGPLPRHSQSQRACQQCCVKTGFSHFLFPHPSLWIQEPSAALCPWRALISWMGTPMSAELIHLFGCNRDTLSKCP